MRGVGLRRSIGEQVVFCVEGNMWGLHAEQVGDATMQRLLVVLWAVVSRGASILLFSEYSNVDHVTMCSDMRAAC